MRLGAEAHSRATHTLAFQAPSGRPYLRHHDFANLRAAKELEAKTAPATPAAASMASVVLPPRPASACASEALEEFRGPGPESVPLQVL